MSPYWQEIDVIGAFHATLTKQCLVQVTFWSIGICQLFICDSDT
jgi:hypothetical protein